MYPPLPPSTHPPPATKRGCGEEGNASSFVIHHHMCHISSVPCCTSLCNVEIGQEQYHKTAEMHLKKYIVVWCSQDYLPSTKTHTHTCTHTHVRTHTHARAHTFFCCSLQHGTRHKHTHKHTYTHTNTHTHTHAHTRTHTHTHTHKQEPAQAQLVSTDTCLQRQADKMFVCAHLDLYA